MARLGFFLCFLLIVLVLFSGCVNTKSEVIEIEEPVKPAETPTRIVVPSSPPKTLPQATKVQISPSPTHTEAEKPGSTKFRWGDLIEAPNGTRYILLEGNPGISGVYTAYRIVKCPCVQLVFLDVKGTDAQCRKVGSQNPNTICGGFSLKVQKEPWDVCNTVEPSLIDGYGNSKKSISVKGDGRFSITGSHFGDGEFTVKILDKNKNVVEDLFAAGGTYENTEIIYLEEGRYTLDVKASGSWKIDIFPM